MQVCSINPTRRRQSNQTMRKIHKHIHQIPMPNGISIRVIPTLHPLIITIPTSHIMTDQQSRPHRQTLLCGIWSNTLCATPRFVKRVVKWVKIRPGLEFFEGFDWIRDWWRGSGGIKWGWSWGGSAHFGGEEDRCNACVYYGVDGFEGDEGLAVYIGAKWDLHWSWVSWLQRL